MLFLLLIVSFAMTSYSQELSEADQAKNAGNEAYRNKDYVGAIKSWEKYLNSGAEGVADDTNTKSLYVDSYKFAGNKFMQDKDYQNAYTYLKKYTEIGGDEAKNDGKTLQYMGYCASKNDNNAEALSLYQRSIELGYNPDGNMLYIATIYKETGDETKMKAILLEALEKYPESKSKSKIVAMLILPMMKSAAEPFNAANELAKKASTSAPVDYIKNMTPAIAKFQEAIPLFEEVLKFDPQNEKAKSYLSNCNSNITSFNEYKASLEKK